MNKFLALLPLLFCCACATPHRNETGASAQTELAQDGAMNDVVFYAVSMAETPYRYGGDSPEAGFDCSGFVGYVFQKSAGEPLPRTSLEISRTGVPVRKDQLRPGDLVFFNTLNKPFSHVGIYVGDDRFVHAPKTGKSVAIADMKISYWQHRYEGARRIILRHSRNTRDTALR